MVGSDYCCTQTIAMTFSGKLNILLHLALFVLPLWAYENPVPSGRYSIKGRIQHDGPLCFMTGDDQRFKCITVGPGQYKTKVHYFTDGRYPTDIVNVEYHFQILDGWNIEMKEIIESVMNDIQQVSCIRFKKIPWHKALRYRHYSIPFLLIKRSESDECFSVVGRQESEGMVSIGRGCSDPKAIKHQLMHAIGFTHKQFGMRSGHGENDIEDDRGSGVAGCYQGVCATYLTKMDIAMVQSRYGQCSKERDQIRGRFKL